MRTTVLVLSGALILTGCDKTEPAPPTLVGIWNLESIRYQLAASHGHPATDDTYVAKPGESPQEFTADGRVWFQRPLATGSFRPYRFDGSTIVVALGPYDVRWTVSELSTHRLVYQEVEVGSAGQFTQTFTYRR
ncbi:hypothetical protein [Hymenobacter glacialis]|uniref:Lipocalin-like domain-containing protein n=1 Tax=Hymenobacter glacialis TaxID=1908236 RepID=A0A1G1T3A5_9BACT|nr:hypothetical protein [Hymenobacter glacialis]OGX85369.1 hypothetical protein BEN48_14475 [Hymenobacter glacialis]